MPIIEAGFLSHDGKPDLNKLLQFGPTIQVVIGQFKSADGASSVQSEDSIAYALVDTGATESCIDIALAQKLQLPIVDKINISGSDGAKIHNVYMAQIRVPILEFTQYGKFAGVNLTGGGQQHQALLGRTFLQNTIMIYDGLRSQITITVK